MFGLFKSHATAASTAKEVWQDPKVADTVAKMERELHQAAQGAGFEGRVTRDLKRCVTGQRFTQAMEKAGAKRW